MAYAVPGDVGEGADRIVVERAWPGRLGPDSARVVIEGNDTTGRVRAAEQTLVRMTQGWVPRRLLVAPHGEDDRLPALGAVAGEGTVVVHRYGRRAVVRRPDRFVKVVRPGRGHEVAERAELGHRTAAAAGLTAPPVLATAPDRVDFGVLPGRSLHDLGRDAAPREWTSWWTTWAERWPGVARGHPAAGSLPWHTPLDEGRTLRGWVERAEAFGVLPKPGLREHLDLVLERLTTGSADLLVVAHRDLHDKQLLADGDRLGLLDFDTASLAEPALDLANLAVHALLRVDQGWWSRDRAQTVLAAVHHAAETLEVDPARLTAYAGATRLRLACVYAFRPRYAALAARWAGGPDEKSLTDISSPVQIDSGP